MVSDKSRKVYFKFLNEKQKVLLLSIEEIINKIGDNSIQTNIREQALGTFSKNTLKHVKELASLVPKEESPQWLITLKTSLLNFVRTLNSDKIKSTSIFIKKLMQVYSDIENYKWIYEEQANLGIIFEDIFQKYKKESKINELFDKTVELLNKIADDENLDSIKALEKLNLVIALIHKNRDSSHFSIRACIKIVTNLIKNTIMVLLKHIPVYGKIFEVLERTIKDLNNEMDVIEQNTSIEIKEKYQMSGSDFLYGPDANLIENIQTGKNLNNST
ncbi:hypothetical protein ACFL35_17470 [Candidatus Riflebacteria bacterium]